MERKQVFDTLAHQYDKMRPRYVESLYKTILERTNLNEDSHVLEIGCGTGQATERFLQTNASITAIEPGLNLAELARAKFESSKTLKVIQTSFESLDVPQKSFDLIYSATAFHWIPAEIGYSKAYSLLKPGGSLALFWNRPCVHNPQNPVHTAIQEAYRHLFPDDTFKPFDFRATSEIISKQLVQAGFTGVCVELHKNIRRLTAKEYTTLIDTYSDHNLLDADIKRQLYKAIEEAINAGGGTVDIEDYMDLYMGQRSHE